MRRAIGLILTITGLVLGSWFAGMIGQPGLAPLSSFIVAAIAVAMVSVGLRYVLMPRPAGGKTKPVAASDPKPASNRKRDRA
jgi:hypothetical protein